ncbi:uncharacterized protein SPPG_09050 [Spizellomyces punctatus DAOM BR117]|uniref:C2H2-type domain-containing protein n=1 Tax=Spizellomyces punctatus (strain DAOM BR117) TaxID=645134 RepID=A0A0L0HM85_SPIPD|nr:uncharacterized protein SPPG_09050 [Spizellomyces punctatus DAOM BR117]KND02202.1 hypothetical protein SPPG_09050 [Spizellomyces punctatus DAOM BR117]|eukprot:XP_016610241.1 hypothetical protein SPPG_09050 [Spizellomyces punctatus DAOM BR117]
MENTTATSKSPKTPHARAFEEFRYECEKCHGLFTSKQGRDRHQATHENHDAADLFDCPLCQRKFTRIGEVLMHLEGNQRIACPNRDHPDLERLIGTYIAKQQRHYKWSRKTSNGQSGPLPVDRNIPSSANTPRPAGFKSKLMKSITKQVRKQRR